MKTNYSRLVYRLDCVPEPRTVFAHFSNLLVAHTHDYVLFLSLLTASIDCAEMKPHDGVAENCKGNHGHGYPMALDEAWAVSCWVDLCLVS